MTNINIEQLQKDIISSRFVEMKKDTRDEASILLDFKQALLAAFKNAAKVQHVDLLELSNESYNDVIKTRYNITKKTIIAVLSKSNDKDAGLKEVSLYIDNTKVGDELEHEDNRKTTTYDQLSIDELRQLSMKQLVNIKDLLTELVYLKDLLPRQLNEDNIRFIIEAEGLKDIKSIMAFFRLKYPNQYDNKELSRIAKSY